MKKCGIAIALALGLSACGADAITAADYEICREHPGELVVGQDENGVLVQVDCPAAGR